MKPLLLALPGRGEFAAALAEAAGLEAGEAEVRRFPDGESYVRVLSDCRGRSVAVLADLGRPDDKIPQMLYLAGAARDLGARRVGLVAPYLAYMRQDAVFAPGECVTSRHFAALVSASFDWLATVDPHLHRYRSLDEIYSIPSRVVSAAPPLAAWIDREVADPLLVGPDAESAQWVRAVARNAGAPYTIMEKIRRGDRDVSISGEAPTEAAGHTPVVVDDIVSTGRTLAEAASVIRAAGLPAPVCAAVHGLFAEGAEADLQEAGFTRVVTTNTLVHASNAVDIVPPLADAVRAAAG